MRAFLAALLIASSSALHGERAALLETIRTSIPSGQYTGSPAAARRIQTACASLESAAGGDSLAPKFPRDLMLLEGTWRLVYTSTAIGIPPDQLPSQLLDLLPAPPSDLQPLREIEQSIDVYARRVINRVSLSPWPPAGSALGGLLKAAPLVGDALAGLDDAAIRLELDHSFSVQGEGSGGRRSSAASSTVSLRLERIRRDLQGLDEGGLLGLIPRETQYELPGVFASGAAADFETSYCDETLRISRGVWPGRELRVFERVGEAPPGVSATRQSPEEWQRAEDELKIKAEAEEAQVEYYEDLPEVD